MAVLTDELEVGVGQADVRVGDVVRRERLLVMDDVSRLVPALFSQPAIDCPAELDIPGAAFLPAPGRVKACGPWLHPVPSNSSRYHCSTDFRLC